MHVDTFHRFEIEILRIKQRVPCENNCFVLVIIILYNKIWSVNMGLAGKKSSTGNYAFAFVTTDARSGTDTFGSAFAFFTAVTRSSARTLYLPAVPVALAVALVALAVGLLAALAVGFVALAVGFVALAVGFVALAVGFVALAVGFLVALAVALVALAVGFLVALAVGFVTVRADSLITAGDMTAAAITASPVCALTVRVYTDSDAQEGDYHDSSE